MAYVGKTRTILWHKMPIALYNCCFGCLWTKGTGISLEYLIQHNKESNYTKTFMSAWLFFEKIGKGTTVPSVAAHSVLILHH